MRCKANHVAESIIVDTYYHAIEDEGVEYLTDETNLEQHAVLNEALQDSVFSFELMKITRTPPLEDGSWFSHEEEIRASLHQGGLETLNIFILQWSWYYGTYASLPTTALLDDPLQDGVVTGDKYLPGGLGERSSEGKVLVHEVHAQTVDCKHIYYQTAQRCLSFSSFDRWGIGLICTTHFKGASNVQFFRFQHSKMLYPLTQ